MPQYSVAMRNDRNTKRQGPALDDENKEGLKRDERQNNLAR